MFSPALCTCLAANRKHSLVSTKSCSLTSLLAPVAVALLLPLPPPVPPAAPLTQRKSTEPPDERRGLLMSSRSMPGLGRGRGSAGAGVTDSTAPAVATIGSTAEPPLATTLVSLWFVCILRRQFTVCVCRAGSRDEHTSAVQRQRERTISLYPCPGRGSNNYASSRRQPGATATTMAK